MARVYPCRRYLICNAALAAEVSFSTKPQNPYFPFAVFPALFPLSTVPFSAAAFPAAAL